MKHLTLSFILLSMAIMCHAQFNYLDTVYRLNNYGSERSYSSIKFSDDRFVVVGYGANTKYQINLFCITGAGDTLWNKQYNIDSIGEPVVDRSILDAQKNILIGGYAFINGSQEVRALLIKTDSSGNLKWIHQYDNGTSIHTEYTGLRGFSPTVTYNNQYLLACQLGVDTNIDNIVVIKTDTNGSELSRWNYNSPYYDLPWCSIQAKDSGFVFAGFSNRLDHVLHNFWSIYIIKTDRNGVVQWDTLIPPLHTDSLLVGNAIAEDIIEVADGFVIAGERCNRSNYTYPRDERGWSKCWYGKISKTDGHLLWQHYLGPDTLDWAYFNSVIQTSDGGYALCGNYNYANDYYNTGWIVKTDANGDTLWSYVIDRHVDSIHYTEQMEFDAIHEIDGGYLATGIRWPDWPAPDGPFPYVITVDGNGCASIGCRVTAIKETEGDNNSSLLVYPNPSQSSWQLTVSNNLLGGIAEVFDADGRVVFKSEIRNSQSEIAPDVSKGIYLLRVSSVKGSVVRKLVKL